MTPDLPRLLEYLCETLNAERLERAEELHRRALSFEPVERLPIAFAFPSSPELPFRPVPNGTIYRSPEAMLYNELVSAFDLSVSARALIGDDLPATIRPNWGTVLTASVLGGHAEQRDDHTPWIRRDDADLVSLDAIISSAGRSEADLRAAGWIPRVLETYQYYHEALARYPELLRLIKISLPDLQGPLDSLAMLRGSELFVELIGERDKATAALMAAAEVQVRLARLLKAHTTDAVHGFCCQHGFLIRGGILVRDDSTVMISPELYRQTVYAADDAVLRGLGGGGIHCCGAFQHQVDAMMESSSLRCIDFGQSAMNDMAGIYVRARPKRIALLRVQPEAEQIRTADILRSYPTGASLLCAVGSLSEATELFDGYRRGAEKIAKGMRA